MACRLLTAHAMRFRYLLVASLVAGCAADSRIEDGETDAFTSADGKLDAYSLTEAEALSVMRVASEATKAELDSVLSSRASKAIAAYRTNGQVFDSLQELDGVPYVGPRSLDALLELAQSTGRYDEHALGRHDVSILVPLPATGDLPWKASMPARGGALLPKAVFDKIGRSIFREIADTGEYDALRVVGVRFDPCFTTSLTAACQPQIRVIFQTLSDPVTRADGTNDGAVHALYNLTAQDFAGAIATLRSLDAPQNRAYQPLGVSPTLKAQGMDSAYARGLADILATYAGPDTLARMTFMTRTDARQSSWQLGGFHVKANAATGFPAAGPIKILGTNETLQVVANEGFGSFNYNVTPQIADTVGATGLSIFSLRQLNATQRKSVAAWAQRQESPTATVPDTTDCASCHVAGHTTNALGGIDAAFISLDQGPRAVGNAEAVGDNLRAFGYFGPDAMVSIRTANETAAVVRALATQR
jgi:hypothetical protein